MRFLPSFVFLVIALLLGVRAQLSIADLPPCGLTCLLQTVPAAGCAFTDNSCICNNKELRHTSADCLQRNCSMDDTLTVAKIQANICDLPTGDLGHLVRIVALTLDSLAAFITFLRFLGKKLSGQRLTLDDLLLAIVVLILVPILYTSVSMVNSGFGKHVYQLNNGDLLKILRYFWIAAILYNFNLGLIKLAIIVFYLRLFPYQRFRYAAWASIAFVVISAILIIFLAAFQCMPVQLYWDKDLDGKCLNLNAVAYAGGAVTIASDILIVVLPIPVINSLQLSWKKKIGVLAMFALGSFGCIVSIIRLQALVTYGETVDPTYDLGMAVVWSAVELPTALVCASFPALRRLFAILFPRSFGTTAAGTSDEPSKPSKSGRAKSWYAKSSFGAAGGDSERECESDCERLRGDFAGRGVEEVELEGRGGGRIGRELREGESQRRKAVRREASARWNSTEGENDSITMGTPPITS